MILSRTSAGGLLRSGDIGGIDSTLSGVSEIRSRSVAILPIGDVFSDEDRWTVLPGDEVLGIYSGGHIESSDVVIVTDGGIVNIGLNGSVSVDVIDGIEESASLNHFYDGSFIQFYDSSNELPAGYPITPPTKEPFSMAVSDAIHVSFIMDDSANLMRYDDVNWVPIPVDISGPVDSSTLATDGDTIAGLYSGLFGSHVCKVVSDTTNCINSGLANSIAVIDGHVFVYGPNGVEVWDVEQGLIQLPLGNASVHGLNSAGVLLDDGTLLVPSANGNSLISGPTLPPNSDGRIIVIHNETILSTTTLGAVSSSPYKPFRPFLLMGMNLA